MNIHIFKTIGWRLALAALAATAGVPAVAADSKPEFGIKAHVGILADSNVNVAELDSNLGESDTALVAELGLDARLPFHDRLSLTLGYGIDTTRYERYDEFDLTLQRFSAILNGRAKGFDAALGVQRFAATLDGDGYLDVSQVEPSIARMFGNRIYLRGGYALARKEFRVSSERDADSRTARLDVYLLLDGMNRYVNISATGAREAARDTALDYGGQSFSIGAGQTIGSGDRLLKLRARARVGERRYNGITESIEARRRDDRLRADLAATVEWFDTLSLETSVAYADVASNVTSAAYDEVIWSLRFGVKY